MENLCITSPHMSDGPVCTLRLLHSDRFSHSRSSRTGIVHCNNPDVVIGPLGQTHHGVRQIFAPELSTASPVLLSSQHLTSHRSCCEFLFLDLKDKQQ